MKQPSKTVLPMAAFAACWLGGVFDGMDATLMTVALPKAMGELCPPELTVALVGSWVIAVFLLGWTLGGLCLGWLGDRYGRLRAMGLSILLYSVFTGLSGLSHTWWQLAACRFLTGLGIGGEMVSITTYLTEVWPPNGRAMAIGALLTSYQAGVFLAGWLHSMMPNWRLTFAIGALPAFGVVLGRLLLKESPVWVAHAASTPHSERSPSVRVLLGEQPQSLWVGSLGFTGLLVGYWASLSWIPTWVNGIGGSEFSGLRNTVTMVQGLAAIAGCLLAGWLCQRVGRRLTIMLAGGVSFLASCGLFIGADHWDNWRFWPLGLMACTVGMLQAALYLYIPELFPTRIRASATGACLNAGRLFTVIAVLSSALLVRVLGGYAPACLCFSGSYLLTALVMWHGRETRQLNVLDA